MSNAPNKKDSTNVSGIFSIGPDPFSDGEIPGVTQLLERKKAGDAKKVTTLEKTSIGKIAPLPKTQATSGGDTKTNLVIPSSLNLKSLGVLFELRFHPESGSFRYSSAQGHKEEKLLAWQEKIFDRMKMDKKTVPAKEPFQEFRADTHAFLFEAFAIRHDHFIQIVSPEYTNTRIVLVSEKSMAQHEAKLIEHFSRG